MYKLLLCLRYLRTRYIAIASIVSVTLGVATLIVVNAVMAGFTHEMEDRMHHILSDVVFKSHGLEGFPNPEWYMERIDQIAGKWVDGMTPTAFCPAMLSYERRGGTNAQRQVMLVGIDEKSYFKASSCGDYLQHPENRKKISFKLREDGYDVRDHQGGSNSNPRPEMAQAGWRHRRHWAHSFNAAEELREQRVIPTAPPSEKDGAENRLQQIEQNPVEVVAKDSAASAPTNPFQEYETKAPKFNPAIDAHPGVILGIALGTSRTHEGKDRFFLLPGDDVVLTVPTVGEPPKAFPKTFTVVDFYESKMHEYDSSFVFVSMHELQRMRAMGPNATSIQIKLKPGADANMVRDLLRKEFPVELFGVNTWRDEQGALLAAVQMEKMVLNILLAMIIAVAGFGILAIFFMIVVEKTRDIGILKSLGASSSGIMGIFLSYGLLLGIVGSGMGMLIGLLFVKYINQIAALIEQITGQPAFDPVIYYFFEIPTVVEPFTVTWIVLLSVGIAVAASIAPALRAALLHPVEALRYE